MIIKSSSTLRKDYDKLVKLSKEKNEPIYLTRNGEGESFVYHIVYGGTDYIKRIF